MSAAHASTGIADAHLKEANTQEPSLQQCVPCKVCAGHREVVVLADPQLRREPLQAQLRKERSEADLTEAARKLRNISIGESIPDASGQEQLPAGQGAALSQAPAPKAIGEDPAAAAGQAAGQPIGQQPGQGISAAHVQQQIAADFQQPDPNPFSSAFAYTERMNSAFSSS